MNYKKGKYDLSAIIFILIIAISIIGWRYYAHKLKPLQECKQNISEQLKSPASAEFSNIEYINGNEGDNHGIIGYIDSQNGFGAIIRGTFYCRLDYNFDNGILITKIVDSQGILEGSDLGIAERMISKSDLEKKRDEIRKLFAE